MARRETVRIEGLAAGGDGIARAADGRVLFVPFTAPGDRVQVEIEVERARHSRGRALELLEPGPGRTDPLCAVFGACGGCSWQHLDYATQLEWKARVLADAFERIARVTPPAGLRVLPSPSPYGWRARARVQVQAGRAGFRRRRSHAVCATSRCPVLVPALDDSLAALAARPPLRDGEVELAAGDTGDVSASPLPATPDARPTTLRVGDDELRISPGVFAQANALLRGALAEHVWAAAGRGEAALELCAGAGFFSLGLARRFERLEAVESDAAALADLRANLERASLGNVEPRLAGFQEVLGEPPPPGLDCIVLDPPRSGLGGESARDLARSAARRIVYVSCDPATLARDVGICVDHDYALVALEGFDLFPQTAHVEAVAVLER